MLLLPPVGGSRQATKHLLEACKNSPSLETIHEFDCHKYHSAFATLLKTPDEDMIVDLLNQSLVVQCLQHSITHLFVPALCPLTRFTLELLFKQGMTTIHWFIEDYRRATYLKDVLPGYSHCIAIQRGPIPQWCLQSNTHYCYLPTAASGESIKGYETNKAAQKSLDIAFVGLPSTYRITILERLCSQGFSLAIAGEGWNKYKGPLVKSIVNNSWIDTEESLAIMQSAKIVLNLSFNKPSPHNFDDQISPRVFDILAMGSVLISDSLPLLDESLKECLYYTFQNEEELDSLISRVLGEYHLLNDRLQNNHTHIKQSHTWEQRVEQILAFANNR